MARVIIAAAGHQRKWGNYLGVPSHLVPVGGEPLLMRTIRQALTISDDVIFTYPGDDRYLEAIPDGVKVHAVSRGEHFASEYAATRDLWDEEGRTILLLGDTYFTDDAIRKIARFRTRKYQGFGRKGKSRITGCRYGELYAASWYPEHFEKMDEYLKIIKAHHDAGTITRPTGWMLLRAWQGSDLARHRCDPAWMTTIDDLTEDWDFPVDYQNHPVIQKEAKGMYEAGQGHAARNDELPKLLRQLGVKARHVVHVGAHEGEEMPYYEAAGFEKITLVEPSAPHAAALAEKFPYAEVLPVACGPEMGEAEFYVMPVSNMSTLVHSTQDTPQETVIVPVVTLADIALDANVAVVDVQGLELEVLKGADLKRYEVVIVETCTVPDATMASSYAEVTEYMISQGYEVVEYWVRDYQRVAKWGRKRQHRQSGEVRDVVYWRVPSSN